MFTLACIELHIVQSCMNSDTIFPHNAEFICSHIRGSSRMKAFFQISEWIV